MRLFESRVSIWSLFAMSAVNITNVTVLDNPAPFLSPFQFEISYECLTPLKDGNSLCFSPSILPLIWICSFFFSRRIIRFLMFILGFFKPALEVIGYVWLVRRISGWVWGYWFTCICWITWWEINENTLNRS